MTTKIYLWNGPATAVEVWPHGGVTRRHDQGATVAADPLLCEVATPGKALSVALDPDHPVVRSWLAFGLVTEEPADPASIADEMAAADETADPTAPRRGRKN